MRILKGLFKILLLPVVLALGLVSALGMTFMKIIVEMLKLFVMLLNLLDKNKKFIVEAMKKLDKVMTLFVQVMKL